MQLSAEPHDQIVLIPTAHINKHTPVWRCVQTLHIAGTGPVSASSWSRSEALCFLSAAAHSRYLMNRHKHFVYSSRLRISA